MPYKLTANIRLTMALDDLDVARIANSHQQFLDIQAAAHDTVRASDFTIETEGPKIVQVRAKGEAEPQAPTLDIAEKEGAPTSDLLSKSTTPAQDAMITDDDPEMPAFLKREGKK